MAFAANGRGSTTPSDFVRIDEETKTGRDGTQKVKMSGHATKLWFGWAIAVVAAACRCSEVWHVAHVVLSWAAAPEEPVRCLLPWTLLRN